MESKDRPHILVIDDDRETLKMLDVVLSMAGFRVSSCADGIEGIRITEEENPDLIILDVLMPEKNGIEVMREIRTNPATKAIPILFLSAVDDEATVVQGLKGADDYVVKQVGPLELEARIRKMLERSGRAAKEPSSANRTPRRLAVKVGAETRLILWSSIYYIEAAGKYSYLNLGDGQERLLADGNIGEFEPKLEAGGHFLRIHRSYVVNLDRIKKLVRDGAKKTAVVLDDANHTQLRVSDSRLSELKSRLRIVE